MYKFTKTDFVDIEKYHERLNTGQILYNREMMNKLSLKLKNLATYYECQALDIMMQKSSCYMYVLNKNSVLAYLQKHEFCPQSAFKNHKTDSLSLDMKKVLEPLYENGHAQEFLENYMGHRSATTRVNNLKKIMDSCTKEVATDNNNKPLCAIPFSVKQQPNSRFNYSGFDIISQIAVEVVPSISVEKDYFLVWGDFAQSDFRVAYNLLLRSEENDRIMDEYPDKYEALARIIARDLNKEFDLEEFKQMRQLYKKNTLAAMYGTSNTRTKHDKDFIIMMNKFLQQCPKYVEYKNRLSDSFELGLPLPLISYFNNVETSPILYRKEDTINRALNAPIQKGTSELVILTVNAILDTFYSLGYTKKDISLYFTRHDEPIFKVHKRVLDNAWVFKQFEKIYVDDWSPLQMTFEFGYNYKIVDQELMNSYEKICQVNKDKIQILEPGTKIDSDYYPIKKVCTLHCYTQIVGEQTVIVLYNPKNNTAKSIVAKSIDDSEIWITIKRELHKIELTDNYRGVIIINPINDDEDYNNNYYYRYRKIISPELKSVHILCEYTASVLCKSLNMTLENSSLCEADYEFIKTVGKLEVSD